MHSLCKTRDTQMPGSGQVLLAGFIAESRGIGGESLCFCSTGGFENAAVLSGPGSTSNSTGACNASMNSPAPLFDIACSDANCLYTPPAWSSLLPMPEHAVFAVVLAAGESSRFGSTKQLAEYDGETLAGRAVRLAEDVCDERTVLVVGNDWKSVLAACGPLRGFFVRNSDYKSGLARSIACGVSAVAHSADAVLLSMADQPLITAVHLNSLISEWRGAPNEIVISEYAGINGPPVIFPAGCFDNLMQLEGDQGARSLLTDTKYSVRGLAFEAAAVDIDTPEDFAKLERNRG